MPPLLTRFLSQILAFLLAPIFNWLANQGVIPVEQTTEYVTELALNILALGWMLWNHYKDRLTFLAAKMLPAGASGARIKATAQHQDIKDLAFRANTDG